MDDDTRFARPTVVHDEPCPDPDYEDDRRGTRIETPYDGAFVAELKERWDWPNRIWHRAEQIWWVEAGHEEEIEELVMAHFGGVLVVDADGRETVRDGSGDYEQGGLW